MTLRVALVTGAGRGIGRASALALAEGGARVAVAARSLDELESLQEEIMEAGGEAAVFAADLTDRQVARSLVAQVSEKLGPVNILVNNAGVGSSQSPRPLVEFDDEFWDLTMELNVTAPYLLTKSALPSMFAEGWGRVINISSINAKVASFHGAAYTASKHAIAGLTKATALEVAGSGVTANAVAPA